MYQINDKETFLSTPVGRDRPIIASHTIGLPYMFNLTCRRRHSLLPEAPNPGNSFEPFISLCIVSLEDNANLTVPQTDLQTSQSVLFVDLEDLIYVTE